MKRLAILACVLTATLLSGCTTFGNRERVEVVAPPPAPPVIPAVPADVASCLRNPTNGETLTAEQIERAWKTDRATLVRVNSCLRRIVCQYQAVRKDIGRVADAATCAHTNPHQNKRTVWQRVTGKDAAK